MEVARAAVWNLLAHASLKLHLVLDELHRAELRWLERSHMLLHSSTQITRVVACVLQHGRSTAPCSSYLMLTIVLDERLRDT